MATREPVRIEVNVEGFSGQAKEVIEVDRDEWDALDATGRSKLCAEAAEAHALNHVGWGWYIFDPDDMAATDG